MEKQYYAVHLLPSRPNFATTMTESERAIMTDHVSYWMEKMRQGKVYALGIVAVENEQELKNIIENDPAGKINKYEYFPMKAIVPNISLA